MTWLVVAIGVAFGLVSVVSLVRHWQGRAVAFEAMWSGYFYRSPNLRRGHVRAIPMLCVWGVALGLMALVIAVTPRSAPGTTDPHVSWTFITFGLMTVACIGWYWSVVLFNRPQGLVAPRLRGEAGVWNKRRRWAGSAVGRDAESRSGVLASFSLSPVCGCVEVGDKDSSDVPQWSDPAQRIVASRQVVLIGTRPDRAGEVQLTVARGGEPPAGMVEVFSGEIELPSGVLAVGNSVAFDVKRIRLAPATAVHVRALVAPLDQPEHVWVVVDPDISVA